MYYNGKNGYDPATFLGKVHKSVRQKYILENNAQTDIIAAQKMENFLQKIKDYFSTSDKSFFEQDADKEFLASIELLMGENENVASFFRTATQTRTNNQQGLDFEKYMGRVFMAILTGKSYISNNSTDIVNITGQTKAYASDNANQLLRQGLDVVYTNNTPVTSISNQIENQVVARAIGSASQAFKAAAPRTVKKGQNGQKSYEVYFQKVDQKVDINNRLVTATATWNVTPETQQAIDLIKNATFTAKSYKSGDNLKIGDTNSIRAFFGVLDDLGYNEYETQASAYLHSLALTTLLEGKGKKSLTTNQTKRGQIVALHVYHMRFIYELIGTGQKDATMKDLATADFLLYNQHNTDKIYVISTKGLIAELFNRIKTFEDFGRANPFKGTMYVRLEWLNRGLTSHYKG